MIVHHGDGVIACNVLLYRGPFIPFGIFHSHFFRFCVRAAHTEVEVIENEIDHQSIDFILGLCARNSGQTLEDVQ